MVPVFQLAQKAARYSTTVLILGESGTGKELIARGIHYEGERSRMPLVPINCGSNNESRTIIKTVNIGNYKDHITLALMNDSLKTEFEKTNKISATIKAFNTKDTIFSQSIVLPAKIKIDPMVKGYKVIAQGESKNIFMGSESSLVDAYNERTADSINIELLNPRKLPVMYIIYRDQQEIKSGNTNSDLNYAEKDGSKSSYFIKYRYTWAGETNELNYAARLEDKNLLLM